MPQQCSAETEKSSWRARRAEGPAADVPLATLSDTTKAQPDNDNDGDPRCWVLNHG
ncbi:hypothetical protein D9757_015433 [Collybiopsis confluens]|uniref:Uncharacterized protein n=1 Tax=Collybiopsis confluens TaxID=2823264 RepID=A0A8H5CG43_9AGAR|nr:hypothetical protein D9757_015433 [Collybiopsis confluens]